MNRILINQRRVTIRTITTFPFCYHQPNHNPTTTKLSSSSSSIQLRRPMSSNILGHNPMSNPVITNKNIRADPNKNNNNNRPSDFIDARSAAAGGVWAQTSAKRDKLGELRMELKAEDGEFGLDDKASNEGERMDLWLMDGVMAVLKAVEREEEEEGSGGGSSRSGMVVPEGVSPVLIKFDEFLNREVDSLIASSSSSSSSSSTDGGNDTDVLLDEERFRTHITILQEQLALLKSQYYPSSSISNNDGKNDESTAPTSIDPTVDTPILSPLVHLRDLFLYPPPDPNPTPIHLPNPAPSPTTPSSSSASASSSSTSSLSSAYPPIPNRFHSALTNPTILPLRRCVDYYRILTLEAILNRFAEDNSWKDLTEFVDADIDRAAAKGEEMGCNEDGTEGIDRGVRLLKLHRVLRASYRTSEREEDHPKEENSNEEETTSTSTTSTTTTQQPLSSSSPSSTKRTAEAYWDLIDKDNDGLLTQAEMEKVVQWTLQPIHNAFRIFITEALEVTPMREPPPTYDNDDLANNTNHTNDGYVDGGVTEATTNKKENGWFGRWKTRRNEKRARVTYMKLLDRTIKKHFDVYVETPHRLRCIYAWADKNHQDGRVESVLVDNQQQESVGIDGEGKKGGGFIGGLGVGRKRYVELDPKISYGEFRVVQEEHFPHLDRASEELCVGLKEELWVLQGKGRQNRELKREVFGFLVGVGIVDLIITLS